MTIGGLCYCEGSNIFLRGASHTLHGEGACCPHHQLSHWNIVDTYIARFRKNRPTLKLEKTELFIQNYLTEEVSGKHMNQEILHVLLLRKYACHTLPVNPAYPE